MRTQSVPDMIIFIFSPLLVILLFILVFISFTDLQEQMRFHDKLLQEGRTVSAQLYKKEDKGDKYGLVFRVLPEDDDAMEELDVFFVIADLLPDDFWRSLEPGAWYEIRYLDAFGMFPEFLDEYRYYISDLKARIIIVAAVLMLLAVNPRILYLGFDSFRKKK